TKIREATSNRDNNALQKSTLEIYHPPTDTHKNSYSISSLNIVILLCKKDFDERDHIASGGGTQSHEEEESCGKEREWSSLKFQYIPPSTIDVDIKDVMNEEYKVVDTKSIVMEEKWFLTSDNIRKCDEVVSKESKWNKVLSPKIVAMKAVRDRDGIIIHVKTKNQPILPTLSSTSTSAIPPVP
ncbi:18304_t:CDS:2, partial [Acaulospora morrowiae]